MLDSSIGLEKQNDDFFSGEDAELFTRDPASFALTFVIFSKDKRSLNELYKQVPETLHDLLDSMISHLQKTGMLEINNSIISLSKRQFDESNPNRLSMFLPKVFEVAAKKLLSKDLNTLKNTKEGIRYLVVPNDPAISNEIHALTKEYLAKINSVRVKSRNTSLNTEGHRMVGVFNYELNVEDFV